MTSTNGLPRLQLFEQFLWRLYSGYTVAQVINNYLNVVILIKRRV